MKQSETQKSVLMDRYFSERDKSSIAENPFFKISSIEWGYGFIKNVGERQIVTDIPKDATGLERHFAENKPFMSYQNGIINIRCVLPAGTVKKHEIFSAINIKDAKGQCIGILAVLPIPVTPDRLLQFDIQIKRVDNEEVAFYV